MATSFYHFTHRQNIEGILKNGVLRASSPILNGRPNQLAISLTTDPEPMGHGLTDGRTITSAQVVQLNYHTGNNGQYRCIDNTEFRIELRLAPSPALKQAKSLHSQRELLGLAIAGYLPCSPQPTDAELQETLIDLKSGRLRNKSTTWWYYFGDLQLTNCRVHYKNSAGKYDLVANDQFGRADLSAIPRLPIQSLR